MPAPGLSGGDREQLLGAVYERHVQRVLGVVQAAIEDAGDDRARRLTAGLQAFVTATLDDEPGARVNYFEMVGVNPELDGLRKVGGVVRRSIWNSWIPPTR